MWFLSLCYIDFFLVFSQLCISGVDPSQAWSVILFIYCWFWFASILLRISVCIFIRVIGLWFSCDVIVFGI